MRRTILVTIWFLCVPQFAFGLGAAQSSQSTAKTGNPGFENLVSMLLRTQGLRKDFERITSTIPLVEKVRPKNLEHTIQDLKNSFQSTEKLLRKAVRISGVCDIKDAPQHLLDDDAKALLTCRGDSHALDSILDKLGARLRILQDSFALFYELNADLGRGIRYKKRELRKLKNEIHSIAKLGHIALKD